MSDCMLKFTVTESEIEVTEKALLTAGSAGVYTAQFAFDEAWDGFAKTAVFASSGGKGARFEQPLPETACCTVPWEVLEQPGYLFVSVYGVQGDRRRVSVLSEGIPIRSGARTGQETRPPTPDQYEQILRAIEAGMCKGEKGDPFVYADFTEEQLAALAGKSAYAYAAEGGYAGSEEEFARAAAGLAEDRAAAETAAEAAAQAQTAAEQAAKTASDAAGTAAENAAALQEDAGQIQLNAAAIDEIREGLGDGTIRLEAVVGKNIFDKEAAHTDGKLLFQDGSIADNNNYTLYDFVPVEAGTTYCSRYGMRLCFYDREQGYLGGVYGTTNPFVFTTPEDCAYIRFSLLKSYVDLAQVEPGDSYTGYAAYSRRLIVDLTRADYDFHNIVSPIIAEEVPQTPYSDLNLAYVKGGRLICNDTLHPDSNANTAKYIGVHCGGDFVRQAEIRFGFTGSETDICSVMLISSRNGCQKTADIVTGSCHFGVTPTQAVLAYYDEEKQLTTTHTHTFAEPLQNDTEYAFSWKIIGDYSAGTGWLSVKYPDGETEVVTDSQFPLQNGPFLIFEHFYSNQSGRRGYYTGWNAIAEDTDGNVSYLRHDFTHQAADGLPCSAPTGQNYILFSNDVYGATPLGYA